MNRKFRSFKIYTLALLATVAIASCDDEPALPDNLATFETDNIGFEGEKTDVKILLTRAASQETTLQITLTPDGVTYGTEFTTEPDGSNGTISIVVPKGSTDAVFSINKTNGVFLDGDESISFTIASADAQVLLGESVATTVNFWLL
jgi:hypothetical protein